MKGAKKKVILLVVMLIFISFGISTFAESRDLVLTNGYTNELDTKNVPAGSWRGRTAVNSISNSPSTITPQLYMIMYGSGFTVTSRTYTSAGSSVRWYNLAGLSPIWVAAEKHSTGTLTANVSWNFQY